ncbi:MAG: DsrE family protein [Chloroflexota bacterium]|nr:DsrE family protein [Chloroflexota bacterium]
MVFHFDEPSKGRADQVFRNIENLLDDLGENNVEVELVANGGGVKALVKGPDSHAEQIGRLAARRVLFAACANSLSQLEIARDTLLESVGVVSSGVGELVKKQVEGWAYIRH